MTSVKWSYEGRKPVQVAAVSRAGGALVASLISTLSLPVTAQTPAPSEPEIGSPTETVPDAPVAETAAPPTPEEERSDPAQDVPAPRETAAGVSRPPSLSLPSKVPGPEQPLFGTFEGTYGLGGLTTGVSLDRGGFLLGGELSVVRQTQEFFWFGGYLDGVYDFERKQTRLSIGPEFGWSALGLDAGYLLALDGAGAHGGITARPLLSIGYVTVYGRVSHLFEAKRTWVEAGLLLKYPVEF